jgi:protein-tyrosine phosphatase
MKSILRSIVGSPKQSHYDPKLNLLFDLSYITPQIIVCSGPVTNYLQTFYRHPVEDLVKFLTANHDSHWHIWNLRGEEPGYESKDVMSKVSHFPFPDHQPPTIGIFIESTKEIDTFLSQSTKNVAVLHCKSGKGRSGTICCSYLIYKSLNLQLKICPLEAIELYTQKRMRPSAGDGVSILSQRRYLEYWFEYLNITPDLKEIYHGFTKNESMFDLKKSCITMIRINNLKPSDDIKTSCLELDLILETYVKRQDYPNGVQTKHVYQVNSSDIRKQNMNNVIVIPGNPIYISDLKDVRISVKHWCFSWFNVFFETLHSNSTNIFAIDSILDDRFIKGQYTLQWEILDGFKGTHQKGMKLFESLDICWRLYY